MTLCKTEEVGGLTGLRWTGFRVSEAPSPEEESPSEPLETNSAVSLRWDGSCVP